jgi:glycosyltransferase involved in cell wall biosynthesis
VVDHGIGRVVANGDVDGVVAALRALLEEAAALGARARTAFEHRFDRTARTDAFADVLRAVAKR